MLLIVLVFIVGVAVGQTGLLGPGIAPRATPAANASPGPDASGQPSPGAQATQPPDAPADFGLFWQAFETIRQNFVGRAELTDTELTYGAIRGLVQALGDTGHSVFLTPDEVRSEQNALGGSVVGIGVLLGLREEQVIIVSVISGGPASRAGILTGDEIVAVNGEDIAGLKTDQVVARVSGEEGTTVVVTVTRPSTGERVEFSIVRERIRFPAAEWAMVPGTDIALLRLIQFSTGSAADLQAARDEALAAGARSFILDLRGNPGGYVDQAVDSSSLFVSDRTVYIRELASREQIPVKTNPEIESTDLPLVVLIDHNSASSAEITAGALASGGRATLVGQTTFGTGTVLLPFDLADGASIRLAVERWLTPESELIFGLGITPTVEVALAPDEAPIEPAKLRDIAPADVASIGDAQLLRAIELLGGTPQATPDA